MANALWSKVVDPFQINKPRDAAFENFAKMD
jgi:hypothetical protein